MHFKKHHLIKAVCDFFFFYADINECNTIAATKCAFRCANLPGTYRCVCPMGYKIATDQVHCEGK